MRGDQYPASFVKNPLPDDYVSIALLAFRLPVCGSSMSDSEGSDSDGSYGGRKKMRRDEAEEVTPVILLSFSPRFLAG